jgi:hypothetical protein
MGALDDLISVCWTALDERLRHIVNTGSVIDHRVRCREGSITLTSSHGSTR